MVSRVPKTQCIFCEEELNPSVATYEITTKRKNTLKGMIRDIPPDRKEGEPIPAFNIAVNVDATVADFLENFTEPTWKEVASLVLKFGVKIIQKHYKTSSLTTRKLRNVVKFLDVQQRQNLTKWNVMPETMPNPTPKQGKMTHHGDAFGNKDRKCSNPTVTLIQGIKQKPSSSWRHKNNSRYGSSIYPEWWYNASDTTNGKGNPFLEREQDEKPSNLESMQKAKSTFSNKEDSKQRKVKIGSQLRKRQKQNKENGARNQKPPFIAVTKRAAKSRSKKSVHKPLFLGSVQSKIKDLVGADKRRYNANSLFKKSLKGKTARPKNRGMKEASGNKWVKSRSSIIEIDKKIFRKKKDKPSMRIDLLSPLLRTSTESPADIARKFSRESLIRLFGSADAFSSFDELGLLRQSASLPSAAASGGGTIGTKPNQFRGQDSKHGRKRVLKHNHDERKDSRPSGHFTSSLGAYLDEDNNDPGKSHIPTDSNGNTNEDADEDVDFGKNNTGLVKGLPLYTDNGVEQHHNNPQPQGEKPGENLEFDDDDDDDDDEDGGMILNPDISINEIGDEGTTRKGGVNIDSGISANEESSKALLKATKLDQEVSPVNIEDSVNKQKSFGVPVDGASSDGDGSSGEESEMLKRVKADLHGIEEMLAELGKDTENLINQSHQTRLEELENGVNIGTDESYTTDLLSYVIPTSGESGDT
eukprot:jgi/Bigna1/146157/aug1.109_g20865